MNITPYQPRQFLPKEVDLTDIEKLAPLFDRLKTNLEAVRSVAELERWLQDHSEVSAALAESSSIRYIAMTCQTDDPEREKAYLKIIEVVQPWLKPRQFELLQKLVAIPWFRQLPSSYEIFR